MAVALALGGALGTFLVQRMAPASGVVFGLSGVESATERAPALEVGERLATTGERDLGATIARENAIEADGALSARASEETSVARPPTSESTSDSTTKLPSRRMLAARLALASLVVATLAVRLTRRAGRGHASRWVRSGAAVPSADGALPSHVVDEATASHSLDGDSIRDLERVHRSPDGSAVGVGPLASEALGSIRTSRGWRARGTPHAHIPLASLAWLAALALLASARAALEAPFERRLAPAAHAPHVELAEWLEGRGPALAQGHWRPLRSRSDGSKGRLDEEQLALSLPAGTRGRGPLSGSDELALLGMNSPWLAARGEPDGFSAPRLSGARLTLDEWYRAARGPREGAVAGALAAVRRRLVEACDTLPTERGRGLASALLLGDRAGIPPALADLFTRTGTRHLLSLSGLHVGLVAALLARPVGALAAALVSLLFGRFLAPELARWARTGTNLAAALAVLAMVPLGGGSAPVARAATAIGLALVAPDLFPGRGRPSGIGRRIDSRNLWGLALVFECVADPLAATRVGVQLSYGATLALLVGMRACGEWARALGVGGAWPAPVGRYGRARDPRWRIPLARVARFGRAAFAASCVSTLATLPIAWSAFGEFAPIGIIATPLVLPLLVLLLASGWGWLFMPALFGSAGVEWSAHALVDALEVFDRFPWTPLVLPLRPDWLVWTAGCALLVGLARGPNGGSSSGGGSSRGGLALRAGALGLGVGLVPWPRAASGIELSVADVGHGSAVVWVEPGSPAWIFDAGSRDRFSLGRDALAPILRRSEIARPIVVLSHEHRDHASGLGWTIERWSPRMWLGPLPRALADRLPPDCRRLDPPPGLTRLPHARGQAAARVELLRGAPGGGNEGSRSLRVHHGGQNWVLSGDAEGVGLEEMLARGWLDGTTRLLLAPHHGSATSLLAPLLDRSLPQEVWISASAPAPIAPTLRSRGIRVRETRTEGPLRLRSEIAAPPGSIDGTLRADSALGPRIVPVVRTRPPPTGGRPAPEWTGESE